MNIRIKICGVTSAGDAETAGRLGADALGLMFAPGSSRRLTVDAAAAVSRAAPPFVTRVAVFMDNEPAEIEAVLSAVRVDLLQFHGAEAPADCTRWGRPYLKAVPMGGDDTGRAEMSRHPDAAGFLLDAHVPGGAGGQGKRFDWSRVPSGDDRCIVLAGGLNPGNVAEAIRVTRPYGVDVSSGVESAPGVKDPEAVRAFIIEARRAAGELD